MNKEEDDCYDDVDDMQLVENQKALYLKRLLYDNRYQKLSGDAIKLYCFLLEKFFANNMGTFYVTEKELAKEIKWQI